MNKRITRYYLGTVILFDEWDERLIEILVNSLVSSVAIEPGSGAQALRYREEVLKLALELGRSRRHELPKR